MTDVSQVFAELKRGAEEILVEEVKVCQRESLSKDEKDSEINGKDLLTILHAFLNNISKKKDIQ